MVTYCNFLSSFWVTCSISPAAHHKLLQGGFSTLGLHFYLVLFIPLLSPLPTLGESSEQRNP